MHMADALISPVVGSAMWAASAAGIAYCSRKMRDDLDESKIPLMGVLGAFVFAAQMINFTIPVTGSSGHLGGGLLLSVLLGPSAAFLVIASVLVVQALFFADGGLLALGCNIFNLGFFPAFIAYPFIYKKIFKGEPDRSRLGLAAILSAIIGLQLGALGVILETEASGLSELPFSTFAALMLPIHLAIGLVEGIVTAAVIAFVWKASPQILSGSIKKNPVYAKHLKGVLAGFIAAAIIMGGFISRYSTDLPDGLDWSISRATDKEEIERPGRLHSLLAAVQEKISFLPDYSFRAPAERSAAARPPAKLGATVSGLVGGAITLGLALFIGVALKRFSEKGP